MGKYKSSLIAFHLHCVSCNDLFLYCKFRAGFEVLLVFVPLQAQDFEDRDVYHRHLSHLFGLFPGHTITLRKTPDLCKAAANSLYKRGENN